MVLHEADSGDLPKTRYPPDIQSAEAKAIWRVVTNLATNFASHATRVDVRFQGFQTSLDNFIGGMRLEIGSLKNGKPPSVPPMRKESPSSAVLLEHANTMVVERLQEMAPRTPGPSTHVEAKPEEIADVVRGVVADVFRDRENASNAKIIRWQHRLIAAAVIAFVTATTGGLGAWVWGKAQGHAEGYVEGRTHPVAPSSSR